MLRLILRKTLLFMLFQLHTLELLQSQVECELLSLELVANQLDELHKRCLVVVHHARLHYLDVRDLRLLVLDEAFSEFQQIGFVEGSLHVLFHCHKDVHEQALDFELQVTTVRLELLLLRAARFIQFVPDCLLAPLLALVVFNSRTRHLLEKLVSVQKLHLQKYIQIHKLLSTLHNLSIHRQRLETDAVIVE